MIAIPKNQLVWSFPPFCCKQKKSNYMKFQIPRLIEDQQKKEEVQPRFKSYQPTGAKMQPPNFSPTP